MLSSKLLKQVPYIIVVLLLLLPGAASALCSGRFPNPITDVCWKCMFPLKIGPATVATFGQLDAGDAAPAVCACPAPPPVFIRVGVGTSFWEPSRMAEAVRDPFCSPTLGGISLASLPGILKDGGGDNDVSGDGSGFYQVHWMLFPLLNWMSILTDTVCVQPESFDVMMISELEPTWNNDMLALIFSPEAVLFSNIIAAAACGADCVAASVGFPLDPLFWCAGCLGSLYPLSGNVVGHQSGVQSSLLAVLRMHTKLHRTFVSFDMGSTETMCLPLPLPIMRKSAYKTQMMFPIPDTFFAHPYGRSTAISGVGKEFPVYGENFSYLIFRKRLCCAF